MAKKHKNVCFVTTVYSFFLFLLLKGYNKEDIYIFTAWFPKEVSKNVKHIQLPPVAFRHGGAKMYRTDTIIGILKNIIGYILYFYGYIKLRILYFIKTFNCDVEVYGHASAPFSFMFYENENSNIIEDGLMNYLPDIRETHKINPIIDKFLHMCGVYFLNAYEGLGSHKNIKKVYLTRENNHPLIKDKVEIIDIEKQWNDMSKLEQNEILNILNLNTDMVDFKGKTALILTEPLTDGGLSTDEEELRIYQEMIDKFEGYKIIIKPHPRESRDYKKIFNDVEVIDNQFPVELLNLMNIKPTVVCSVVSTALLNFKDTEIYVYEGNLKNKELNEARDVLISLIEEK